MKPSSASGLRRFSDSAGMGGHRLGRRSRGRRTAAPLLRLREDLVAEVARIRQEVEDLGALRSGGVDLNPPIAEDAAEKGLTGHAILDAVDRRHPLRPPA